MPPATPKATPRPSSADTPIPGRPPATRVPDDLLVHLRRARDLVDKDYAEPLRLDELAATAGVSKYHFLRCFAAVYAKTPAVYLAERRIERAQAPSSTRNTLSSR